MESEFIISSLINELSLKREQVENVISLIDEGNTIPFIARYRKERTGNMDDVTLRNFDERLSYLKNLENRKNEVSSSITQQEKMTDEIKDKIAKAKTLAEIEDIYRPYKQKRKTRASIAKEKGLEPLAEFILTAKQDDDIIHQSKKFINEEKEINSYDQAINGALDIIAENISDNADFRKHIRLYIKNEGLISSKKIQNEDSVYDMYENYSENIKKIPPHRILAINRGEKEGCLRVSINIEHEKIISYLAKKMTCTQNTYAAELIAKSAEDSYKRLIFPSIEREIRSELFDKASESAIKVFSANLKRLLLSPPLKNKTVLGLDPAYRTGCKIGVVDKTGKVLDTTVIYPTPPQNKIEESKRIITNLINKYDVDVISIGNGTASKESEIFIADLLHEIKKDIKYMVVSEAGASVYSASKLGAEEFPDFDVAQRSSVSIARRLQDPLAELVKIEPQAIGVGQYQHDMKQNVLASSLTGVVEDCVNSVGVDLNTASWPLLSYISGINTSIAKNIVSYREENGEFKERKELLKVSKLGKKAYEQCAGFLRIIDGKNVLDNTGVHPESYCAVKELLKIEGLCEEDIGSEKINALSSLKNSNKCKQTAEQIGIGELTLADIISELEKPGRDIRDDLPKPQLRSDIMDIKDLREGMVLTGTVRNVTDFGAFVDIGVHHDGLVHISEISDKYIKHPLDVLSTGDIIQVKVMLVDLNKNRIALSMKNI